MKTFIRHLSDKSNLRRALRVSLIVGTILAIINHYDMFVSGHYETRAIIQILLTYLVPFAVSLYSMASHGRRIELGLK